MHHLIQGLHGFFERQNLPLELFQNVLLKHSVRYR
jgi:hypothetical protein